MATNPSIRKERSDKGSRKTLWLTLTCEECGEMFDRPASAVRTKTYCSRKCVLLSGRHKQWGELGGRPKGEDVLAPIREAAPPEVFSATEKYGAPNGWLVDRGYITYLWRKHPATSPSMSRLGEHRVVAYEHLGDSIKNLHIDHINGNRADNNWSNLRAMTPHEHLKRTARDQGPAAFLAWAKENHPEVLEEFGHLPA